MPTTVNAHDARPYRLKKRRTRARTLLLWAVFLAGLVIESLAPRLQIQNRAFVIPPSMTAEGKEVRPDRIVERERRMQWAAGILTIGGALGLAFAYRDALARALTFRKVSEGGADQTP
jgi:hypothetical protein